MLPRNHRKWLLFLYIEMRNDLSKWEMTSLSLYIIEHQIPIAHMWYWRRSSRIGLYIFLIDRFWIYIRHPPDHSNRSNWMSDSGLYDRSTIDRNIPTLHLCHIFHISHYIDILFME
jgi:hypothetical protein